MPTNLMTASRQWATRPQDQHYESLDALYTAVHNRRLRSRSADIAIGNIEAGVDGNTITLNHGIKKVEPSHWAFGQLSAQLGAPANYLRSLPASMAVENLNHGIRTHAKEIGELKFMTVTTPDDDGFNTLQAVTGTTYGRIWDADVVSCAKRIVEKTNGKFYNPKAYDIATGNPKPSGLYASDRDVFMFLIDGGSMLDAGPRAQLNRGFFMWNSEVGSRTFGLTTFLFNTVCGNHIVWGAQDIRELRIRHTKNGPARFDADAIPTLTQYVNGSAAPEISAICKAQNYLLPAVAKDELVKWLQTRKFTKTEALETINAANKEEGDCRTLWHAIQGATAYARGFDYVDARVELESKAGALMELVKN